MMEAGSNDKRVILPAGPSFALIPCPWRKCNAEIEVPIRVRVIMEPVEKGCGQRTTYAVADMTADPVWNHILAFHGPEDDFDEG